jgi:hypothetical protein
LLRTNLPEVPPPEEPKRRRHSRPKQPAGKRRARDFLRCDTFAGEAIESTSESRMPSSPRSPFRKHLLRRLDRLAGEVNHCLAVAAIGLACVDLVGYAVIVSQAHPTNVAARPLSWPIDSVGTAPVVGLDQVAQ